MRQNSTSTIFYLYDKEERIADYDMNGNLLISYTHGPGIDEPVAMTVNNSTYFYIPDIHSSPKRPISGIPLGIRPMVFTDEWKKPHPLPIAPIGSPFWRWII